MPVTHGVRGSSPLRTARRIIERLSFFVFCAWQSLIIGWGVGGILKIRKFIEDYVVKNLQIKKNILPLHRNLEIKIANSNNGALVQLVRIRACHARGQGFESPTHRKKDNRKVILLLFSICCVGG